MNLKDECIVGIDFGLKRVGLAVCSKGVTFAVPSTPVEAGTNDKETINRIIEAFHGKVDRFVLGLPTFLDGKESIMTVRVKEFGKVLEEITGKPLHYVDERLTSEESEDLLKELGMKRKERIPYKDSLSAKLILNDFLTGY